MTIAIGALISILISEFIDKRKGAMLLAPLLVMGIISIFYWVQTGDLRLYAFLQFYPLFKFRISISISIFIEVDTIIGTAVSV